MENDKYAAFLRRVIRAYSRRVGSGDIEAITEMVRLAADLEDATCPAIARLRGSATPGPTSPCGSASPAREPSNAGATPPATVTDTTGFPDQGGCP